MLYLNKTSVQQVLQIPSNGIAAAGAKTLTLFSTMDRAKKYDGGVTDATELRRYYEVAITLGADIPVGEYEYELRDASGVLLSSGLAQVGDFSGGYGASYDKTIEYEQY